tara:strand:+ start:2320 stop:3873 length:1554 start_codon:yes stop_codon:yes gene_type:complete
MAIEKTIIINVETGKAVKSVDKLSTSIEGVGDAGEKSVDRYSGSIKKSNILVEKLNQATGGLSNTFLNVADSAKKAGVVMKTAIISTGIGVLLVSLGLVVSYWDDIVGFVTGANKELEKQIELRNIITKGLERELKLTDSKTETLKRAGVTEREIRNLKKEQLRDLLESQRVELEKEKARLTQLKALKTEGGSTLQQFATTYGNFFIKIYGFIDDLFAKIGIDLGFADAGQSLLDFAMGKVFGTDEDISETDQRIAEIEAKIVNAQNRLDGILNREDAIRTDKEEQFSAGDGLTPEDAIIFDSAVLLAEKIAGLSEEGLALAQVNADQLTDIQRAAAAEREALRVEGLDNIIAGIKSVQQLTQDVFDISNVLGKQDSKSKEERAKKNFAVQKALNLTLAGVDAFKAITSSLAQSPIAIGPIPNPAGIASLAFAAVSSAASIAKIAAAKFKGGSVAGGAASAPSAPPAPSFNLVEGSASNQIADSVQSGTAPVKSYVVSGDVSSSQELDRNIQENASL